MPQAALYFDHISGVALPEILGSVLKENCP